MQPEQLHTLIAAPGESERRLLKSLVEPFSRCVTVTEGEEALAAFEGARAQGEPFKLVFLDVAVPGFDGYTVLAEIRAVEMRAEVERKERAVVLLLSERSDLRQLLSAARTSCDGCLIKPLEEERVLVELSKTGLIKDWSKLYERKLRSS